MLSYDYTKITLLLGEIMRIFICGGVDADIKPKYRKGIKELAKALIERGHSIILVGSKTGCIGDMYNTYIQNGGDVDLIVPDCYADEAEQLTGRSVINVTGLHMLQQVATKNSDATIILPGGNGTMAELYMITDNVKAGFDKDLIIIYNINGFYDMIKTNNDFLLKAGAMKQYQKNFFTYADTYQEVLSLIDSISK